MVGWLHAKVRVACVELSHVYVGGSSHAPDVVTFVSWRTWSTLAGQSTFLPPRMHTARPNVTWHSGCLYGGGEGGGSSSSSGSVTTRTGRPACTSRCSSNSSKPHATNVATASAVPAMRTAGAANTDANFRSGICAKPQRTFYTQCSALPSSTFTALQPTSLA